MSSATIQYIHKFINISRLRYALHNLTLLGVLFPYISIFNFFHSGVQVYPFIFGFFFLILQSKDKFKELIYPQIYVLIFLSILVNFILNISIESLRVLFSFTSFFMFYLFGQLIDENKNFKKIILLSLYLYFIFGFAQYFYPDLFLPVSSREYSYNRIGGRGVESVTPEPTFFGFIGFFIFYLAYTSNSTSKIYRGLISMLFFMILVISKSSSLIITLIISFILRLLKYPVLGSILLLMIFEFQDSRFNELFQKIFSNIANVGFSIKSGLLNIPDLSITDRLNHIIYSHYLGISSLFGNPLDSWRNFIDTTNISYITYGGPQPFSFFGGVFYFTGVLGFLFLKKYFDLFLSTRDRIPPITIAFTLLLFQSTQISLPIIGLIFGITEKRKKVN